VWTVRDTFAEGQHAEAGGDLIETDQAAIRRLVDQVGLSLRPILRGGFAFVRRGSGRHPNKPVSSVSQLWPGIVKLCDPWIRAYRISERRWESPIARMLGRLSVAEWLDQTHADQHMRAFMRGLRGFFLADPEDLSLLALVDELTSDTRGRSQFYRIMGGNDRLATSLAARLREPVRLRAMVLAATQTRDRVRVTVGSPDGTHTQISTDYLVLAVPATTLRHIVFGPPLPPLQRNAIQDLRYGRATKTLLQFTPRFWQRRGRPRAYGTDLPIGAVWDANEEQRGRAGILTLLAGGSVSMDTRKLMAEHGVVGLVNALGWLGATQTSVLAFRQVCWEEDPWARGGYAYFDPAYDPELRTWLARPHGQIVFAGEHTSLRWQGYMNGAVESGLRAAAEVQALQWQSRRSRRSGA
jgi:monoamine oxidase